jgi:hypothetical protein
MNKKRGKLGQANISFGMIFSIILIIIFLAFGFYAITKFIEMQKTVQIQQFSKNLQDDVDKMWKSVQGSQEISYTLPNQVTAICFQEDEFQNMKFVSENPIPGKQINNIDIVNTVGNAGSLCIKNNKGKVKIRLLKEYGETLVTLGQ